MVAPERDIAIDYAYTYAEKLQVLYKTSSHSFPEDEAFWQGLAQEQAQHLQWLQQIKALCKKNNLHLGAFPIHLKSLESAFPYMEVVKGKIERQQWPMDKVIDEVRDFEQNLIDCGLVPALQTAGGPNHPVIEPLIRGIEQHCDQLHKKRVVTQQ